MLNGKELFLLKRITACLLCLLLLFLCAAAAADTVSYGAVSFDTEAGQIDMGEQVVTDYNQFIAFLRQFPNLKKVDMFATLIPEDKVQKLEQAFPDVSFGWYPPCTASIRTTPAKNSPS